MEDFWAAGAAGMSAAGNLRAGAWRERRDSPAGCRLRSGPQPPNAQHPPKVKAIKYQEHSDVAAVAAW